MQLHDSAPNIKTSFASIAPGPSLRKYRTRASIKLSHVPPFVYGLFFGAPQRSSSGRKMRQPTVMPSTASRQINTFEAESIELQSYPRHIKMPAAFNRHPARDLDGRHHENTQPKSPERKYSIWSWMPEIISLLSSISFLIAICFVLTKYDGEPLPEWASGINLNTLVAVFATLSRALMLVVVAEGQYRIIVYSTVL